MNVLVDEISVEQRAVAHQELAKEGCEKHMRTQRLVAMTRVFLAGLVALIALGESTLAAEPVQFGAVTHLALDAVSADETEPQDDLDLRSARLGFIAAIGEAWRLRTEYEFAPPSEGWRAVSLQYRFRPGLTLRIGNQNVGFGLEESSPDSVSPFMERPTSAALTAGRLTGAMVEAWSDFYTVRGGVFGDRYLEGLGDARGNEGRGMLGRAVVRPFGTMNGGLHLGGSIEYRDIATGSTVRIRGRSESNLVPLGEADTGRLSGVDHLVDVGAEVAWAGGSWLLMAEYIGLDLERGARPSVRNSSWQLSTAWVLTGQRRIYRTSSASFAELPVGGRGALELAARVTGIDLNSGAVRGGHQTNRAIALNWYPNDYVKVALQYARLNSDALGPRSTHEDLLQLRVQLHYRVGEE